MAKSKSTRATQRKSADRQADAKGGKILRQMRRAPAVFTHDEVHSLESKISADADGPARRIALAVLTQPGVKLLDAVADRSYAVAIADSSQRLGEYLGRLHQLTDVLESAQMRMVVALATREDMQSVIEEVQS